MKYFLWIVLLFFCLRDLSGAVNISRVMLKNGSSLHSAADSYVCLECQVDNPDDVPHDVELVLQTSEYSFSEENVNFWRIHVPAKSSFYFRGDAKIYRQEKYELAVYCDKVKQSRKADNAVSIKVAGMNEKIIGIWNDDGDPPGGFAKNEHFRGKFISVSFGKNSFPVSGSHLKDCSMLLIVRPEYGQYSSRDFSMVLEYAANGGTVIFMDPLGILGAAETPLNVMLPVIPLGVRKCSTNKFLSVLFPEIKSGILPDCKEVDIFESVPGDREGTTFAMYENYPLFRQGRFGLGMVKLLAFAPEDEAFPAAWKVGEKSLALLCRTPVAGVNASASHTVLDMLTGFSVLPVSVVRNIILGYFLLLVVILVIGHYRKKHVFAWFCCGVAALAACGTILFVSVKMTDKKKNVIISSVAMVNAFAPEVQKIDSSVFTAENSFRTAKGDVWEKITALPLPRNSFGYHTGRTGGSGSSRIEPLKAGMDAEGRGTAEMTIFPKSSKRFTGERYGKDLFRMQDLSALPEIHLYGDSVSVRKWVLPGYENAEGIFYVFPGGAKTGSISGEGICSAELGEEILLSDPMLDALRNCTALLKGNAAPFLAGVFPVQDEKSHHQGKKILLYPLRFVITGEKVTLPPYLIAFTAANHTSRMIFDGMFLREGSEFMAEVNPEIIFSLPSALRGFVPEEIRVKVVYSGREHISMLPKLKLQGKKEYIQAVRGEEADTYIFRGEALKNVLEKDTVSGVLVLVSELTEAGQTVNYSGTKAVTWKLHDLSLSVKGKLPAGKKKIRF